MSSVDHSAVQWRKSSRSTGQGGNCVEVAGLTGRIAVRDSKNPNGPILAFDTPAFATFLRMIKATSEDRS